MRTTPRKNFRGFALHAQALVDRLVREEFPELAPVQVGFWATGREETHVDVAYWQQFLHNNKMQRHIKLTARGEKGRRFYLEVDDVFLVKILRHELLHGEMRRRGRPHGDNDVPFIAECVLRGLPVNPSSMRVWRKEKAR